MTTFVCDTCLGEVEVIGGVLSVVHLCPMVTSGSDRYRTLKAIPAEALRERQTAAALELATGTTWDQCPILPPGRVDLVCENV